MGAGQKPGHGGFLVAVTRQHTEQRDGANGANGRDGRMWLIDSGLNQDEGLKLQEIGN